MKPYLSIVIPAYNAQGTLVSLFTSLVHSRQTLPFEVIVVDDASRDGTASQVRKWQVRTKNNFLSLILVRNRKNRGPAAARNRGAKKAKGEVVLFLDSDVEVFPDTLYQVATAFQKDADLYALTGVWDKRQRTKKFFPRFKALRDWSYWVRERDQRGYYYLFSTRVAAIRRNLFLRLGGFDESYQTASVEDIEFTYRVARRYAVVFNPRVRVKHEFEGFLAIARKYFIRSREWSALYSQRGKFDPVAATRSEAVTAIAAVGLVAVLPLWLGIKGLSGIKEIGEIEGNLLAQLGTFFFFIWLFFLFVHLWGVRKFLGFVYQEEGPLFAIKSFFMGLVLYLIIVAGALAFAWERVRTKWWTIAELNR